jgi:hypothetical protein
MQLTEVEARLSHAQERVGHPSAISSGGKAGEGTCAGSVSGLCTAGNTQASAEAEWGKSVRRRKR